MIVVNNKEELIRTIDLATRLNGKCVNLNHVDTSQITDMSHLFDTSDFDGDISLWNVSNVRNMSYMFNNSRFNGDISRWDVSKVEDMSYMFSDTVFNRDIGQWNVSKVKDMRYMFSNSTKSLYYNKLWC
jgi:hypothetical protein